MNNILNSTGMENIGRYQPMNIKENYDLLIRIQGASTKSATNIKIKSTASVFHMVESYFQTLLEIVRNLKKQLDYSGYYISYLLGQLNDAEFDKVAKTYVSFKKNVPLDLLKNKIYFAQTYIDNQATPADLAYYFQCEEDDIIKASKLLKP